MPPAFNPESYLGGATALSGHGAVRQGKGFNMTLEIFDVFSIFMAGLTVGLIGAHHLNKWERKAEYQRGFSDGLWDAWRITVIRNFGLFARDKSDGGQGSDNKTVLQRLV